MKNTIMASNIYKSAHENDIKLLVNPISNCAYPKNQNLYEEKYFWTELPMNQFLNMVSKKYFLL